MKSKFLFFCTPTSTPHVYWSEGGTTCHSHDITAIAIHKRCYLLQSQWVELDVPLRLTGLNGWS